ncbi:hypothetical protein ABBQ32_001130 [Trebouxia sp. C0010 RCD-2024]
MSHLGNSPSNSTGCPLGPWRSFEGIILSPHALLSPDGKLHSRPFTRKRKAASPPSGRNMQAEICKYAEANLPMETKGERRIGLSGQLPLAATVPPKEPNKDEWWTTLGHSSLDVSAILQRAFPKAHTGSEVAKQDGFKLADMVTAVSASCGLPRSAIWSAPAQRQRLRRCIAQTIADHSLLVATAPAPVQAPATVAGKPTSHDGQGLPCSQAVLNGDSSQIYGHYSSKSPGDAGKTSRRGQRPAHVGTSLLVWPVASASGRRINTAQDGVPCTSNKMKLEPMACDEDAAFKPKVTGAAAWSQDGCAVPLGQPISAAQKASKRLKPMPAVLAKKVEAAVCKQEDIPTTCNDAQADHATRGLSSERRAQSISAPLNPAPHHLIREMSPQKRRSRRPESAPQSHSGLRSQIRGRRQGAKHASSSFQSAAAASEMTANTDQREALHRLLESTKRCNWGSHRSIKQINNDYRSHINYKPQSGYS